MACYLSVFNMLTLFKEEEMKGTIENKPWLLLAAGALLTGAAHMRFGLGMLAPLGVAAFAIYVQTNPSKKEMALLFGALFAG